MMKDKNSQEKAQHSEQSGSSKQDENDQGQDNWNYVVILQLSAEHELKTVEIVEPVVSTDMLEALKKTINQVKLNRIISVANKEPDADAKELFGIRIRCIPTKGEEDQSGELELTLGHIDEAGSKKIPYRKEDELYFFRFRDSNSAKLCKEIWLSPSLDEFFSEKNNLSVDDVESFIKKKLTNAQQEPGKNVSLEMMKIILSKNEVNLSTTSSISNSFDNDSLATSDDPFVQFFTNATKSFFIKFRYLSENCVYSPSSQNTAELICPTKQVEKTKAGCT